jgi:hypothetical protein
MRELTKSERLGMSEDAQIIYALNQKVIDLLAQLDAAEKESCRLEGLVQEFQASALIDVGNVGGPCCVEPRHIEAHVTELRAELDAAKAACAVKHEALQTIWDDEEMGWLSDPESESGTEECVK